MMPEVGKLYQNRLSGDTVVVLSVKPTATVVNKEIDELTLFSVKVILNNNITELHHSSSGWAHYYQEAVQ
jgi:hypothetical protein